MISRSSLAASSSRRRQARAGVDVLVVCTGNICRSPYVAGSIRLHLPALSVASAGTHAARGSSAAPEVTSALADLGAPPPEPARRVRAGDIRRARLVLTMTQLQRAEVIRLVPTADARTYTLKELARLVSGAPAPKEGEDRLAVLMDWAHQRVRSPQDHPDDLDDPYGGPPEGYAAMMREADVAVRTLAKAWGEEAAE